MLRQRLEQNVGIIFWMETGYHSHIYNTMILIQENQYYIIDPEFW